MPRSPGPRCSRGTAAREKESAAGAALASMKQVSASSGGCGFKPLNIHGLSWHGSVSPLMSAPGRGRGCLRPGSLPLEGQPRIRSARPGGRTRTPGGVLARLAAGFNRVGHGPEADASYRLLWRQASRVCFEQASGLGRPSGQGRQMIYHVIYANWIDGIRDMAEYRIAPVMCPTPSRRQRTSAWRRQGKEGLSQILS